MNTNVSQPIKIIQNTKTTSSKICIATKKGISNINSGVNVLLMNSKTNNTSLHYVSRFDEHTRRNRFESGQMDVINICTSIDTVDSIWCCPVEGEWELQDCITFISKEKQDMYIDENNTYKSMYIFNEKTNNEFDMVKFKSGLEEYNKLKIQIFY